MTETKSKVNRAVGERLKELREYLKLSRHEMARNLGVTLSALIKNETGETVYRIMTMRRLAEMYKVSLDWLYLGRGGIFYQEREKAAVLEKELAETRAEVERLKSGELYIGLEKELPELRQLMETLSANPPLRHELMVYYYNKKEEKARAE